MGIILIIIGTFGLIYCCFRLLTLLVYIAAWIICLPFAAFRARY